MKINFALLRNFALFITFFGVSFSPNHGYASGFRIANQSVASVGLAGAHIAYTPGPDASYYNPANMSFLDNSLQVELSLTTLNLPTIKYADNRLASLNGASDEEWFFFPLIHVASEEYSGFRFGFSLTYPYGLSKQWDQPYPAISARNFTLLAVEGNPTLSYAITDTLSIGAGLRVVYAQGEMENLVSNPPASQLGSLSTLYAKLDGDATEVGYNLAATFSPSEHFQLAATYRSEVILGLEGESVAGAQAGDLPPLHIFGDGALEVALPAVFALSGSLQLGKLTVELVWDRTFWSAIEQFDPSFSPSVSGTVFQLFDTPTVKNWEDADAFRIGAWYRFTPKVTLTGGIAFEETPVPDATIDFDLPDSDAVVYSAGLQYQMNPQLTVAVSYMYHHTTARSVQTQGYSGLPGLDGTFDQGGAHAATLGVMWAF